MSGGPLDYAFHKIEDIADRIRERSGGDPMVAGLVLHLEKVAVAVKALEWWWSGDTDRNDAEPVIRAVTSPSDEVTAATEAFQQAVAALEQAMGRMKAGAP